MITGLNTLKSGDDARLTPYGGSLKALKGDKGEHQTPDGSSENILQREKGDQKTPIGPNLSMYGPHNERPVSLTPDEDSINCSTRSNSKGKAEENNLEVTKVKSPPLKYIT